jgi:hypothetical protein
LSRSQPEVEMRLEQKSPFSAQRKWL